MSKLLVHIDYGSRGNSGLYIKKTLEAISHISICESKAFVNYEYSYNMRGIVPTFEKHSSSINSPLIKKVYKFIDLYSSFYRIYSELKKEKKQGKEVYVVISLNTPWIHYLYFRKLLNKIDAKLYYILHDIVPLYMDAPRAIIIRREELILKCDGVIVHTDESKRYALNNLVPYFSYPFPLMELNSKTASHTPIPETIEFLYIGGIRPEKGVQLLIDAINQVDKSLKFHVTIAGKVPKAMELLNYQRGNITLVNKFLSDSEYLEHINNCSYVVLPYLNGTNSGVLSTVASTKTPVITSDLDMFKSSPFVQKDNVFESGNCESLTKLIESTIINYENKIMTDTKLLGSALQKYSMLFSERCIEAYEKIID